MDLSSRMIILSGDAHMLAVDDGSHSVGGVKVFHAAALDAKPTTKGGPYSHGVWPGSNQYATMDVRDNGSEVCFLFQGWRWKRDKVLARLVSFDTCDAAINTPFLYTPSPLAVQRFWKRVKLFIEAHELSFVASFVVWLDSSRINYHSLTDPTVMTGMVALLIGISSLVVPYRRVLRLVQT